MRPCFFSYEFRTSFGYHSPLIKRKSNFINSEFVIYTDMFALNWGIRSKVTFSHSEKISAIKFYFVTLIYFYLFLFSRAYNLNVASIFSSDRNFFPACMCMYVQTAVQSTRTMQVRRRAYIPRVNLRENFLDQKQMAGE